ncbi:MAG TPA: VWA domain-containing protein [Pseudobdellovibrionaceae bacterium]|jgi:nitric oxide reductase NorD protein
MSFDEQLFGWIHRKYRDWKNPAIDAPGVVHLEGLKGVLQTLARAYGGRAYEIHNAEKWGGIQGLHLYLPAKMSLSPDEKKNIQAYVYRTLISVGFDLENIYFPANPEVNEQLALKTYFLNLRRVSLRLQAELPQFVQLEEDLIQTLSPDPWQALWENSLTIENLNKTHYQNWPLLWGLVYRRQAEGEAVLDLPDSLRAQESAFPQGTELQGKIREKAEVKKIPLKKQEDSPLIHIFEKVKTAEDYNGGFKNMDGSDEILEHEEAIDELEMKSVIRTEEGAASLYRADIHLNINVPEIKDEAISSPQDGLQTYLYPEWDYQKKLLKPDWCTLRESVIKGEFLREDFQEARLGLRKKYKKDIERLRQQLEKQFSMSRWRGGQKDGPEIDLSKMVDRYSFLQAGQTPPENLYMRRERRDCDWASYILIDTSLSTDSWVNNKRVLNFEREAIYLLGEAMGLYPEQIQIGAFYSHTRQDCRLEVVKAWDESWIEGLKKLWSLKPRAYTRIGPAIRHASAQLEKVKARKKFLILLSDGKPTDFDRYEGHYGIEDVKHALRQATQRRIQVHALTVEEQAKSTLAQMFLYSNYQIVKQPEDLVDHLLKIYLQR